MQTQYLLSGPPIEAFLPAIVALVILVLALGSRRAMSFPSAWSRLAGTAAMTIGALALVVGGVASGRLLLEYARLQSAVRANTVEIITGCLSGFAPAKVREADDIAVFGRRIVSYGERSRPFGFHVTEIAGGPIHADSSVRLVLVGNTIIRADVEQHACPVAAAYRA
jgi:hypothetical protein